MLDSACHHPPSCLSRSYIQKIEHDHFPAKCRRAGGRPRLPEVPNATLARRPSPSPDAACPTGALRGCRSVQWLVMVVGGSLDPLYRNLDGPHDVSAQPSSGAKALPSGRACNTLAPTYDRINGAAASIGGKTPSDVPGLVSQPSHGRRDTSKPKRLCLPVRWTTSAAD
jgi:hypothetical protein